MRPPHDPPAPRSSGSGTVTLYRDWRVGPLFGARSGACFAAIVHHAFPQGRLPGAGVWRWLEASVRSRDDVFIDLRGTDAGERWRDTLRKANATCEAVILLASSDSVASVECPKELER